MTYNMIDHDRNDEIVSEDRRWIYQSRKNDTEIVDMRLVDPCTSSRHIRVVVHSPRTELSPELASKRRLTDL